MRLISMASPGDRLVVFGATVETWLSVRRSYLEWRDTNYSIWTEAVDRGIEAWSRSDSRLVRAVARAFSEAETTGGISGSLPEVEAAQDAEEFPAAAVAAGLLAVLSRQMEEMLGVDAEAWLSAPRPSSAVEEEVQPRREVRPAAVPADGSPLGRGRSQLVDLVGSSSPLALGPVLCARELLIQAYATMRARRPVRYLVALAAEVADWGVSNPQVEEYPLGPLDEGSADAALWAGIALSLLGEHSAAAARLQDARVRWQSLVQTTDGFSSIRTKVGRCTEELAEAELAAGRREAASLSFGDAAALFSWSGAHDRAASATALSQNVDLPRLPSDLLAGAPQNHRASSVLGSSSADELRRWLAVEIDHGVPS